jgi:carboxylate-amine ligase
VSVRHRARIGSFEDYARLERQLVESGSIEDRGELWYDVRPHSGHGTVEIRAPDGQDDPEVVLAFVEYVHALVLDLAERYEDGETIPQPRREVLDQNKWRAIRRGRDASFVRRDGSGTIALDRVIEREADRLGVEGVLEVLDREGGATRQRRMREESGVDALCDSLVLSG